ncbi:hypothetical protein [Streptomyces sp. YPW6]|uniref:hypothetical protein n=1 Tax=Streptomyces sp. YPW6 TaxID=2840373 RepID=UPI003EBA7CB7
MPSEQPSVYDCPVCLDPLLPDTSGALHVAGVTKDGPDNWVWGPYPVHDGPCVKRIAHPGFALRIGTDGYEKTALRVPAQAPETHRLLDHWAQTMRSPYVDRLSVQYWADLVSGPVEPLGRLETPWPALDEILTLKTHRFVCLGTRSRSREAQAGYDIAVHNAARGLRVALFAPDLTPRNPLPNLVIDRGQAMTVERIEHALEGMDRRGERAALVIIDRIQTMSREGEDGPRRVTVPDDIDAVSLGLKHLAMRSSLGSPPVLLIARIERPRRDGSLLSLDDLGAAAELVYHTDFLAVLDRTRPAGVDILVAKDRWDEAPRHITAAW